MWNIENAYFFFTTPDQFNAANVGAADLVYLGVCASGSRIGVKPSQKIKLSHGTEEALSQEVVLEAKVVSKKTTAQIETLKTDSICLVVVPKKQSAGNVFVPHNAVNGATLGVIFPTGTTCFMLAASTPEVEENHEFGTGNVNELKIMVTHVHEIGNESEALKRDFPIV